MFRACLKNIAVLLLLPAAALACSGPEAEANVLRSVAIGWGCFGLCCLAVIVGAVVRRRRRLWTSVMVAPLLPAHPAIWVSARNGDCGLMKVALSVFVTAFVTVWAAWPLIGRRSKESGIE